MSESSSRTSETEAFEVSVRSCKYDGHVRRSWPARVRQREGTLLVLDAFFAEEIRHKLIGNIAAGTLSTEFFWTDRWYSVYRFQAPDGRLLKFYCNLNTPPTFESGILTFVDLDVDLLVQPDYSYTILDEDEFEQHARRYGYPEAFREKVQEALLELRHLIEQRQFPFNVV